MPIIKAKFSSICPKCQRSINVGDKISWEKGFKGQHVTCGIIKNPGKKGCGISEGCLPYHNPECIDCCIGCENEGKSYNELTYPY